MKKFLVVSFVFALVFGAVLVPAPPAQDWRVTNQATVAWDAPTTLESGDPIPAEDTLKYEVWIIREADVGDSTKAVFIEETDQLQSTITFAEEGRWFVGVVSVRYPMGETEGIRATTINWSNENGDATPNPFGIKYFAPPAGVTGLR